MLELFLSKWRLQLKADGVVRYQTIVSNPREFRNVKVYAGWNTAANARLRNLDWTSCKSSSVHYRPPTTNNGGGGGGGGGPIDCGRWKREAKRFKRRMPDFRECPWGFYFIFSMNKFDCDCLDFLWAFTSIFPGQYSSSFHSRPILVFIPLTHPLFIHDSTVQCPWYGGVSERYYIINVHRIEWQDQNTNTA